jgi:hypothetical protein
MQNRTLMEKFYARFGRLFGQGAALVLRFWLREKNFKKNIFKKKKKKKKMW